MKTMIFLLAAAALAQPIKLPPAFDDLAKKAKKHTEVQLDAEALKLAGESSPKIKGLTGKMQGVYIRSYEFKEKGQYSMEEAAKLAQQLDSKDWKQVMSVKEDDEFVLMFSGIGAIQGMVMIVAEPDEFTLIQITGSVGMESLGALGALGRIPAMASQIGSGQKKESTSTPPPPPKPAGKPNE
jgi:hypothetical protein